MYAFLGRHKPETSDVVITRTIFVCHQHAYASFDWGSTFSYVSTYYATRLDLSCEPMYVPSHVATPISDSLVVGRVYRACVVTI